MSQKLKNKITEKKSERYEFIDISKGISILLVIIGHIISTNSDFHKFIYSFHMMVFFMLSSLVLKQNILQSGMKKKLLYFSNLWIPYLLFSFLYIIYNIIECNVFKSNNALSQFLMNLFLTFSFNGIGVLWYLSTLFLSILLLSYFLKTKGILTVLLLCSCILFSYIIKNNINYSLMTSSFYGKLAYYNLIFLSRILLITSFLYLGLQLKDFLFYLYTNYHANKYFTFLAFFFSILIIILLYNSANYNGIVDIHQMLLGNNYILFILNSLLGLVMILFISIFLENMLIGQGLALVGEFSLIIMLYHNNFGVPYLAKLFSLFVYDYFPYRYVLTIIEMIATLILVVSIYILFAKTIDNAIKMLVYKIRLSL